MGKRFGDFKNYFYDLDRIKYSISIFLFFLVISLLIFWDTVASQLGVINDLEKIPVMLGFTSIFLGLLADMIYKNNKLMKKMELQLEDPFDRLQTFVSFESEIKNNIKNADEIWLLSRTGINWWENFFMRPLNDLKNPPICRFLFICPDCLCPKKNQRIPCNAMRMAKSTMSDHDPKKAKIHDIQRNTLNIIKGCFDKNNASNTNSSQNCSELRTINYLPSWALLIINPHKRNGKSVIYVEFATFSDREKFQRPVSRITSSMDLYNIFIDEFNNMWEKATLWDKKDIECKDEMLENAMPSERINTV